MYLIEMRIGELESSMRVCRYPTMIEIEGSHLSDHRE